MQQSSKGLKVNSNVDDLEKDLESSPSAFSVLSKDGKKINRPNSGKRDSGYMTDNSPANFGSQLMFNFDFHEELGDSTGQDSSENSVVNSEDNVEDKSDQEVEMVLSNPASPVYVSAVPSRPTAPLPQDTLSELDLVREIGYEERCVSITVNHSGYAFQRFPRCRRRTAGCYFRPIENRSIGTQTPNPHSQIVQDSLDRYHPYGHIRDSLRNRTRHYSAGEPDPSSATSSPLPDIIPVVRDRSVSLPDVPSLRQQQEMEVGRELRRISDEFHHSFISPPRRNNIFIGAQSFPGTARFHMASIWDSLRSLLSSPVTICEPVDDTEDVFSNK